MKTFQKLAITAAIVVVVAVIALWTRSSWGTAADVALNYIVSAVTGMESDLVIFAPGDGQGGTNNDTVDWEN